MDQDKDVKDARAKLAARFGNTQIGGKGKFLMFLTLLGTQRRTKKVVHHTEAVAEDKKLKATIKKFGKSLFCS